MEPMDILKNKGIKITKGRIEILNILKNSENSLSAEKIYQINKNNNIAINLSTVYRTLELFEEKEIIEKITLNDGVFSYRLQGKTHKHYLECDICHKEVEITCPMLKIQELVENATGFTLTGHDLVMKGVCKDCRKKKQT